MKRFATLLLCIIMAVGLFAPEIALGAELPSIKTPRICLIDGNTGAVLYEKDARTKAYPASTTKIMTVILALEMCPDLNEVVNVGSNFDTRGSLMKIVRNEELRIIDLIYGTMMISGNDAASALAVHIAGSQDNFSVLMNQKAADIGMNNTHFVKANGLHVDDHYSTAYDMALLGRYAMQNEKFREICSAQYWDVPPSQWDSDGYHLENANRLIHMMSTDKQSYVYEYATGIKTGDTDQAGRCIVCSAKKNGVELILVLFGDPQGDANRNLRYENAPKFFEWGFENYATLSVSELGLESSMEVPVSNGAFSEDGGLTAAIDLSGRVIAGTREHINDIIANKAAVTREVTYKDGASSLSAPINAGDEIGTVTYSFNGSELLSVPLTALSSVDEIGNIIEEPNPSASPLIGGETDESEGSPLLFWILIGIAALLIFVVIRIIMIRNSRRRRRRRKRARARKRMR